MRSSWRGMHQARMMPHLKGMGEVQDVDPVGLAGYAARAIATVPAITGGRSAARAASNEDTLSFMLSLRDFVPPPSAEVNEEAMSGGIGPL